MSIPDTDGLGEVGHLLYAVGAMARRSALSGREKAMLKGENPRGEGEERCGHDSLSPFLAGNFGPRGMQPRPHFCGARSHMTV